MDFRSWINWHLVTMIDTFWDLKICGKRIHKMYDCPYEGGYISQPTHYLILDKIFKEVELTEKDSFVDIGCGQGRVLAYLIRKKSPCKRIDGVEINEILGKSAREWTKKIVGFKLRLETLLKLTWINIRLYICLIHST